MDLDALIRQAVTDAQVIYGDKIAPGARPLVSESTHKRNTRNRPWTPDEEEFYLANAGRLTLDEIGKHLGRSAAAIKCHYFRSGLRAPSRQPGYLTTHQVSKILGIDSHKPTNWVILGVMPGEQIASPVAWSFHRVSWIKFKMWLVKPESWIYFDARLIKIESLRHLVLRAQERWGDEWWSARQAADYLHVDVGIFDQKVRRGKLYGIQARHKGGRDYKAQWAFWFFRKSDILKLKIVRGKGGNRAEYPWPEKADAYLLRARDQHLTWEVIGKMMHWSPKRCAYRYHLLTLQNPQPPKPAKPIPPEEEPHP